MSWSWSGFKFSVSILCFFSSVSLSVIKSWGQFTWTVICVMLFFFPFFMWKGWVFTMNREFEIPTNFNRTVTHNFRSTDRLYLFWVLFAPWNWFENSSGLINWTKRKETEKTLCFCTVLRFDVEFILRDQMVCVKHNS